MSPAESTALIRLEPTLLHSQSVCKGIWNMVIHGIADILTWSLFGLMICIALLITFATYWLTR